MKPPVEDSAIRIDLHARHRSGQPTAARAVRAIDIALALFAIIPVAPIMLLIAIIIRVIDGKSVLFKQERSGLNGQVFEILKFRTLRPGPDDGLASTTFGQLLRRTSLDELPQLLNILRGDMSFVGPRPLLPEYEPYFSDEERTRFAVRPGLTGLAQISGRNALSWDDKLASDVRFVKAYSVGQYVRILAATPAVVIRRHGASTMWNEETRLDDERRQST